MPSARPPVASVDRAEVEEDDEPVRLAGAAASGRAEEPGRDEDGSSRPNRSAVSERLIAL
jgi:hypothetical protein